MKERVPQDAPASPADVCPTPVERRDIEVARDCLTRAAAYLTEPATPHTVGLAMLNAAIALDRLGAYDACPSRPHRYGANRLALEIAAGVQAQLGDDR